MKIKFKFPFLIFLTVGLLSVLGFGRAFASCPSDSGQVVTVTGGLKVEANDFAYILKGVPSSAAKTTPGVGCSVGGFVFFDIHKSLALQIDLFYHFRQTKVEQQGNTGDLYSLSVELPFYVMGQWRFKDCSRLYLGTGPTVEFGYYAVIKGQGGTFDLYQKDDETELSAMQNTSMGWAILLGYEFAFGLQLNVTYKGGFYNVLDANRTEVGAYPCALSLGVGYRFGLTAPKNKGGHAD